MRTTIVLDEDLVKTAMELTNISKKTALLHAGLEALIAKFARQKLKGFSGKDKKLKACSTTKAAMILVDTSVWIDFYKFGNRRLYNLLDTEQVLTHDFILGELAMGGLKTTDERSRLMSQISKSSISSQMHVIKFVERFHLHNSGIGWVDANLLHTCFEHQHSIWSLDKKLTLAAKKISIKTQAGEAL